MSAPSSTRSPIDLTPLTALLGEPPVCEPMPGGASTRQFFRVRYANGQKSAVAFFVPDAARSDEIDKTDGHRIRMPFLEVHELLEARGVRVPALVADGTAHGWVIVEDLGDDTLAAYLAKDPSAKPGLYRTAVRDLAKAQSALAALPPKGVISRRAFDEDLLAWELQHFREWALEARGIQLAPADRALFDGIASRLAHRVAGWPRGFVHRDYQSRNLMVEAHPEGGLGLVWIDFQDALLGPRIYDLVALLNDSYQTFDRAFVEARIADFADAAGLPKGEVPKLVEEFDVVTVQRKLKDAGRFVFIDREKGNPSFLPFVEPTIAKARASIARLEHEPDMRDLGALLDRVLPSSAAE